MIVCRMPIFLFASQGLTFLFCDLSSNIYFLSNAKADKILRLTIGNGSVREGPNRTEPLKQFQTVKPLNR